MARLIEPRDSAEVTVTVRHRCPSFIFGSALGPGAVVTHWWVRPEHDYVELVGLDATPDEQRRVSAAVVAALGDLAHDYRRHLDELAELPDALGR